MAALGARASLLLVSERERIDDRFPTLAKHGYQITSQRDDTYNCVAWIARDPRRWWAPDDVDGYYWPYEAAGSGLADYVALFEYLGFEKCCDGSTDTGHEKIAVYGDSSDFDHVAFQRADGKWSSKLGELNDVCHAHEDSLGGEGPFEYPEVELYMRRRREDHPLADTGLLLP